MTDAINHYTDINVCLFMHRYRKSNHGSSISILLRFLFCFPLSLFCIIIYLQSPFFLVFISELLHFHFVLWQF